jgi:PTS system nitrogen regulatory IIA component
MRIVDFLRPDAVISDLAGRTGDAVLMELCQPLGERTDPARLVAALLEREKLGSTAVGDGVAIPHARIAGLTGLTATLGRSKAGVEFGAMDGRPVHLFFALFTPSDDVGIRVVGVQIGGAHVKALARISLVLKDPILRGELLHAQCAAEIHRLIARSDGDR